MQLMFVHTKASDGLDYVQPLPTGHWLYELREWMDWLRAKAVWLREWFW